MTIASIGLVLAMTSAEAIATLLNSPSATGAKTFAAAKEIVERDAAEELNQRFKLGLEGERLTKAECDKRELERQRERDQRDNAKRAEAEEWARACDAEREARLAMLRFSEADADKRAFSLALARLCEAQQRCDVIQAARGAGTG